ncbi:unnamed protein product, partial [Heterosigma akashiwo]
GAKVHRSVPKSKEKQPVPPKSPSPRKSKLHGSPELNIRATVTKDSTGKDASEDEEGEIQEDGADGAGESEEEGEVVEDNDKPQSRVAAPSPAPP